MNKQLSLKSASLCLAMLFILSACSSGIVPMGQNTYRVSNQSATGYQSADSSKAAVLEEAAEFCEKKGLEMSIVSLNARDGVPGRSFAAAELIFRALPAGEAERQTAREAEMQASRQSAYSARRLEDDKTTCKGFGFTEGTDSMANCLLTQQQRHDRQQADEQSERYRQAQDEQAERNRQAQNELAEHNRQQENLNKTLQNQRDLYKEQQRQSEQRRQQNQPVRTNCSPDYAGGMNCTTQ